MKIDKSVIIAGSICNASKEIPLVFKNIERLSKLFTKVKCILVESDSIDNTIEVLKHTKDTYTDIDIEVFSFGSLSSKIPYRTGRIATARNFYLDRVESDYLDYDYLLVLVFNESNTDELDLGGVISNFKYSNWDMICANQEQIYYDLWALRHPIWMPFDCWDWHSAPEFMNRDQIYNIYVRSRFIHIDKTQNLIKVQSAFGGSAFIKIKSIQGARHSSLNESGREACEWISFCERLNNKTSNIFINPSFINQTKLSRHANI